MEDQEEDEYYCYYMKENSLNCFFRNGFRFGKIAVVTGVVISCSPLFVPSLVIVSALGFAVSVPAGVVLASYTCTEKLMSILLPIPDFSYTGFFEEGLGDEIEGFEVGRTDRVDRYSIELDAYEQMNDVMVSKADEVPVVLDIKKVVDNDVSRDKLKGKRNMKNSKYSCLKISHRIGERGSKKHNSVNRDAMSKVQNLVPIVEMKSYLSPNSGDGISYKRRDELTVGVLKGSEAALYNVPKEDDDSYKVNAKIPANEVVVPGAKILWDKVDALRLIVGYNAARKASLSEELRALYVFTGIEPTPSSLKNSSSGDHVITEEEKLRFLMSIIGVK